MKNIALVAHDNKKKELIDWIKNNKKLLSSYNLCGTGTTARLVQEITKLPVKAYKSGPLGGDQEIGALIANEKIDILIFFWDPLEAQPHDPDVKALLRIAVLYNTTVAMNINTANKIFNLNNEGLDDIILNQDFVKDVEEKRVKEIKNKLI